MDTAQTVLKIRDLSISFHTMAGTVHAVRGVNLDLRRGETVAIVGESGSGKSVSVKSIMGIRSANEHIDSGTAEFTFSENGRETTVDLLRMPRRDMQRRIKGKHIAMVFQDPMTSLDPTMTVGKQLCEGMREHLHYTRRAAWARGIELLDMVGIIDPEKRMKSYPHQLSGGMRQRVVIAMALSCDPDLLICDEPTTALDVTIQARILQLILDLQKKLGISVIFITHNFGVVAKVADYVNVMYAGRIVETGTVQDVFFDPRHPYTWGLLCSIPQPGGEKVDRLYTVPGSPPNLINEIRGDAFAVRNPHALKIDFEQESPMFRINDHHYAATWLLDPRAPHTEMPEQMRLRIRQMRKEAGLDE